MFGSGEFKVLYVVLVKNTRYVCMCRWWCGEVTLCRREGERGRHFSGSWKGQQKSVVNVALGLSVDTAAL